MTEHFTLPPGAFIHHDKPHPELGGVHIQITFTNGYKASVVRHCGSYGADKGLFELAVIGHNGRLDYTTPITHDVVGNLTVNAVDKLLLAIHRLPDPRKRTCPRCGRIGLPDTIDRHECCDLDAVDMVVPDQTLMQWENDHKAVCAWMDAREADTQEASCK